MGNTVKGLQDEFNDIIRRPQVRVLEGKPASPKIQDAFNILNEWQGKKDYLLAVKIEQDKLINGLK